MEYQFSIQRGNITAAPLGLGEEEPMLLFYDKESNVLKKLRLQTTSLRTSPDAIIITHQERNDGTLSCLQFALCALGEICIKQIEQNPDYGVARVFHHCEKKDNDLYITDTVGACLMPLSPSDDKHAPKYEEIGEDPRFYCEPVYTYSGKAEYNGK